MHPKFECQLSKLLHPIRIASWIFRMLSQKCHPWKLHVGQMPALSPLIPAITKVFLWWTLIWVTSHKGWDKLMITLINTVIAAAILNLQYFCRHHERYSAHKKSILAISKGSFETLQTCCSVCSSINMCMNGRRLNKISESQTVSNNLYKIRHSTEQSVNYDDLTQLVRPQDNKQRCMIQFMLSQNI